MNTNRKCGCKSFRTCALCEYELGLPKDNSAERRLAGHSVVLAYDPTADSLTAEKGELPEKATSFYGIRLIEDFVSTEEEGKLIAHLDDIAWDVSVSGRRKQNFGPKANFKGRKAKLGNFRGFPECTRFVQERFASLGILKDYKTVEQCAIEYRPVMGACIEPHIDDCWIWGERIVQLNLLSHAVLTLFPYTGHNEKKYNLDHVARMPRILDEEGRVTFNPFEDEPKRACNRQPHVRRSPDDILDAALRIPLPPRSLLVMWGQARYDWEHCVLREDVTRRRLVIAYREFTPTYLPGGDNEQLGREVLKRASNFFTQ